MSLVYGSLWKYAIVAFHSTERTARAVNTAFHTVWFSLQSVKHQTFTHWSENIVCLRPITKKQVDKSENFTKKNPYFLSDTFLAVN